jgi:hypothetical protein
MRSGAGAVPTGGRGWRRSGPQRNPLWVPRGRGRRWLHRDQMRGRLSVRSGRIPCCPRCLGLGVRRERHRASGPGAFLRERMRGAWSIRSLPLSAPGRPLALSQRRSDPAPGFLRLGQSPPCPQRSAATVAPSCRAPLPEQGRAQLDSVLLSGSATFHPPRAACFPALA